MKRDDERPEQPWRPEEAEGDWEWNEEDFLIDEDDGGAEPSPRERWIRRMIVVLLAGALFANVLAVIPLVYNWNVIQFLKVTRELSQDERIDAYKQAIVIVSAGDRKGTGFNMDEQGRIITNHHVVEDAASAVVGFPDDRTFHADVIMRDANADLAVLQVKSSEQLDLPYLEADTEQTWTAGMPIYYIGNPLFFHHIAGKGSVLGLADIRDKPMPVMMIDAPIYQGNSGSPVINDEGKVIAVIYATAELTVDGQRVEAGLAIPADHPFLER